MVKKQTNSKRFERRKQKNTSKEGLRNKNPNKNSPEKNNIAITSFIQNTPSRYLAIYELIIQIDRLANHVGIHEKYVFQVTYLYDYFMKNRILYIEDVEDSYLELVEWLPSLITGYITENTCFQIYQIFT